MLIFSNTQNKCNQIYRGVRYIQTYVWVKENYFGKFVDNRINLCYQLKTIIIEKSKCMHSKFSKNSFFNLPSLEHFPDINHTLKMINTINGIPNHQSMESIQLPLKFTPLKEQDSLGQRMFQNTTPSAKKKKNGCTCKKTFCLKMYCECFSTGKECGEDCACIDCKNTSKFKEEIAHAKTTIKDGGLRNCSLAQKRCNCKKSNCLKRYCECFNSGVGCSDSCKCQGCKNTQKPFNLQQIASKQSEELVKNMEKQQRISQFPSLKRVNSLDDFQKYYD